MNPGERSGRGPMRDERSKHEWDDDDDEKRKEVPTASRVHGEDEVR